MLLELLKRDLRLHWDVMVLPYLVLVLASAAIGLAHEGAGLATLILLGALFIPFLPMAIHLRETTQGTLGQALTLPASRAAFVRLRYLEVLLFACVMLVLGHLGSWIAASLAAHRAEPFGLMDRSGVFVLEMMMLICFAYPMPFTLRWDGKGLVAAFALLWGGATLTGLLLSSGRLQAVVMAIMRFFDHLVSHPVEATFGLAGLFAFSYLLSKRAFEARDF